MPKSSIFDVVNCVVCIVEDNSLLVSFWQAENVRANMTNMVVKMIFFMVSSFQSASHSIFHNGFLESDKYKYDW